MTHHDDDRLAAWLSDGPAHAPAGGLERALGATDGARQRPAWLVSATGGTIAAERTNRSVSLMWAFVVTVALIGLLIGGIIVGNWFRPVPPPSVLLPSPSDVETTVEPEPTPVAEAPLGGGLILAYRQHVPRGPCEDSFSEAPYDLFSLDAGTGEQTLLGTAAEDCSVRGLGLQWAADREHVLMTDEFGQETVTLDTPTAAGRDLTFICCDLPTDLWQGGAHHFEGWVLSPSGDRAAAIHTSELQVPGMEGTTGISDGVVVANVDGSGRATLSFPAGAAIDGWATWSPDESALVVAACLPCNLAMEPGQPATAENHGHLYILPADGSPARALLDDTTGWYWTPAWSPDGSTLATLRRHCVANEAPPQCNPGGALELVLVDVEDGSQRVIVTSGQFGEGLPELGLPLWSSDGVHIALTADTANLDGPRVFVIDADGTNAVDLGGGSLIQWSPDGEWLLVERTSADGQRPELWVMHPDGSDARSLGTFQSWWRGAAW